MSEQTYKVGYKIQPLIDRPMTRAELQADDLGGCDAVVIHSIVLTDDGTRSEIILSFDGRTGEALDDGELFHCFVSMAHALSQSQTLGEGRRLFCQHIFEEVKRIVLQARSEERN